ncbi:MAG: hypothetical protein M0P31_15525 [Solirubrobacteraceae bacterium]|nr:hypothetical protein [Solirubrobacteraceae bacterium]
MTPTGPTVAPPPGPARATPAERPDGSADPFTPCGRVSPATLEQAVDLLADDLSLGPWWSAGDPRTRIERAHVLLDRVGYGQLLDRADGDRRAVLDLRAAHDLRRDQTRDAIDLAVAELQAGDPVAARDALLNHLDGRPLTSTRRETDR